MDTEGDFVITWQSNGNIAAGANQDSSGYGVYAQRFSPGGVKIGGVDSVQMLTFSGQFVSESDNFTLQWTDAGGNVYTAAGIYYDSNPAQLAANIQGGPE